MHWCMGACMLMFAAQRATLSNAWHNQQPAMARSLALCKACYDACAKRRRRCCTQTVLRGLTFGNLHSTQTHTHTHTHTHGYAYNKQGMGRTLIARGYSRTILCCLVSNALTVNQEAFWFGSRCTLEKKAGFPAWPTCQQATTLLAYRPSD